MQVAAKATLKTNRRKLADCQMGIYNFLTLEFTNGTVNEVFVYTIERNRLTHIHLPGSKFIMKSNKTPT